MSLKYYKYINNQKPTWDTFNTFNTRGIISFNPPYENKPLRYENLPGPVNVNTQISDSDQSLRYVENLPGPVPAFNDDIQMPTSNQLSGLNINKPEHLELKEGSGKTKNTDTSGRTSSLDPTSALMATANFAGDIYSAYSQPVANASELMSQAGTSYGNVGGIQYQRQNSVDVDKAVQDAKDQGNQGMMSTAMGGFSAGAATGAMLGGAPGAAIGAVVGGIGGLLAGSSAKRRAERRARRQGELAQRMAVSTNIFNRSQAQSDLMRQQYMQKYGNTQGGVLYSNKGKDIPMYNQGKNKVWSPDGYVPGYHNSYVGKGEVIANLNSGKASVITKGKVGVDNQKSSVQENDDNVILGNDIDFTTGKTFAEQGRPYADKLHFINESEKKIGKYGKLSSLSKNTTDLYNKQVSSTKQRLLESLKDISNRQLKQHDYENNMKQYAHYSKGKSEYLQMALPSIIGITDGIGRYINANKQRLEHSNTYYENPYAQRALYGLAGLRYDIDPELRQYANQQAYNKYAIDQQGGLTAGQKYIAKNSLYNDYINNVAKLYANANNINNQYKAQYYDQLMKAGEANRSALTSARRYDADVYAKAKAAQLNMAGQARKDILENIYRMDKRFSDYNMWKDTNRIYEQDMANKKQDTQNKFEIAKQNAESNERIARMLNRSNNVIADPTFASFMPYQPLATKLNFKYFGR